MNLTILLVLGVVAAGILIWKVTGLSMDGPIDRAIKKGDMEGLLEALIQRPEAGRPTAFNRAIKRLWDNYQREEAVPLIRALAEHHGEVQIAQYWLDTLRTVEPELAAVHLESGFLDKHFKAEVAAKCGAAG